MSGGEVSAAGAQEPTSGQEVPADPAAIGQGAAGAESADSGGLPEPDAGPTLEELAAISADEGARRWGKREYTALAVVVGAAAAALIAKKVIKARTADGRQFSLSQDRHGGGLVSLVEVVDGEGRLGKFAASFPTSHEPDGSAPPPARFGHRLFAMSVPDSRRTTVRPAQGNSDDERAYRRAIQISARVVRELRDRAMGSSGEQ